MSTESDDETRVSGNQVDWKRLAYAFAVCGVVRWLWKIDMDRT